MAGGWRRAAAVRGTGVLLFVLVLFTVPHRWCAREAGAWFRGEADVQGGLARGVEAWVRGELDASDLATGSELFDGEWLFGTYMMAAMGFGQTALEHPEWRARHAALMDACIERLLSPEVRAFDRGAWGEDPLDSLDGDHGHAAYLGYLNLVLSLRRRIEARFPHAALNDRITAALARRLERSPIRLLETYPGQTFPIDNLSIVGARGLHARATGADVGPALRDWGAFCRAAYVDPATGLLYQRVDSRTGAPVDHPRGSGTLFGSYFLSFADPVLSRELYESARKHLAGSVLGFGVAREYPAARGGRIDIDSGPILLGYGVTATGLLLACSRIHGDFDTFSGVFATVDLFGAPVERDGRRGFVTGGPIGNAILFAALTATPAAAPREGVR